MLLHNIRVERRSMAFLPASDQMPDFQSKPLTALGLPMRALNAMHAAGILTLRDAANWSLRELQSLPQFGPASIRTLGDALARAGLSLQPNGRRRKRL